ncbi:MAG: hydroxyisourate hydrolase [Bacteroidetes bacterium RIFCSPLOWO2_02_FULL_36_8]|nr:MAG: hydroxyisourate hydrolase [Bacteroidetes bacterium RIFCSPLOWO2_02_FULL_36_8]OFY71980.1 MAG: hydroxyisourate hydrolase [Bacteroidetes bacterium RIFCSPLOWO2_12_FULL_37_12]
MAEISTHILDTSLGKPAEGIIVILEHQLPDSTWQSVGKSITDQDGRIKGLMNQEQNLKGGDFRLTFFVHSYFKSKGLKCFFPEIHLHFNLDKMDENYHIPLLISPYGYYTYRGS